MFTKKVSNVSNIINNDGNILRSSFNIKLDKIRPAIIKKSSRNLYIPNPNIGSLSLETCYINDISRVYYLGYYTKQHGLKIYYLDTKSLDSNKLFLDCNN